METRTRTAGGLPVVVIGAGLAGLTAAATAARAGAPVIILDAHVPGGRARPQVRDGFHINQGPHALYRGGPGRRVLRRLGIRPTGHFPRVASAQALCGGQPRPFPKAQAIKTVTRLAVARAAREAGRSASQWIASLQLPPEDASYLAALIRNTSYVADLDRMPAGLAIAQLRTALWGVDYLDGGWAQLTSGLLSSAAAAGAQLRPHVRAEHVDGTDGTWRVYADGETTLAAAVVVAAGRPAAARRLLPIEPRWGDLGPEVTAACLDLGLRRAGPPARYTLGIDEPLYLSVHCPPGDLAPAGCELVHLMRYGARDPAADRAQLWNLAATAGISRDEVVLERFLPRLVVVSCLPSPQQGLDGRVPVAVPGAPGLFLAGDWVGPRGWLADGSLASGEQAGLLAARAAQGGAGHLVSRVGEEEHRLTPR